MALRLKTEIRSASYSIFGKEAGSINSIPAGPAPFSKFPEGISTDMSGRGPIFTADKFCLSRVRSCSRSKKRMHRVYDATRNAKAWHLSREHVISFPFQSNSKRLASNPFGGKYSHGQSDASLLPKKEEEHSNIAAQSL